MVSKHFRAKNTFKGSEKSLKLNKNPQFLPNVEVERSIKVSLEGKKVSFGNVLKHNVVKLLYTKFFCSPIKTEKNQGNNGLELW